MSHNVYNSVRPLYLLLKLSGFAFYSVDSKTLKISFTLADALLTVFHLILVTFLNYVYWNIYFDFAIYVSEIVKCFFRSSAYLNFVVFTFIKVWIFFQRHKFCELLQKTQIVDNALNEMGINFDYKRQGSIFIKLILPSLFIECISTVAFYFSQRHYELNISAKSILLFFYGFYSNFLVLTQFLMLVCGIKERYKAINEILK